MILNSNKKLSSHTMKARGMLLRGDIFSLPNHLGTNRKVMWSALPHSLNHSMILNRNKKLSSHTMKSSGMLSKEEIFSPCLITRVLTEQMYGHILTNCNQRITFSYTHKLSKNMGLSCLKPTNTSSSDLAAARGSIFSILSLLPPSVKALTSSLKSGNWTFCNDFFSCSCWHSLHFELITSLYVVPLFEIVPQR